MRGTAGGFETDSGRGFALDVLPTTRALSSPSKPPDDDEEPEYQDKEDNVPEPPTALSRCHIVHPSESTLEDTRRLCERIVLQSAADGGVNGTSQSVQ